MRLRLADVFLTRSAALSVALLAVVAGCAPDRTLGSGYEPFPASMERRVIANITFDFDSAQIRPEWSSTIPRSRSATLA